MQISTFDTIDSRLLKNDDILFYISNILLSQSDEQLKNSRKKLKDITEQISTKKGTVTASKTAIEQMISQLTKEKTKSRIFSVINILKQEGKIIGKNKQSIIKIINEIDSKDFSELRKIEERLTLHLPDKYK